MTATFLEPIGYTVHQAADRYRRPLFWWIAATTIWLVVGLFLYAWALFVAAFCWCVMRLALSRFKQPTITEQDEEPDDPATPFLHPLERFDWRLADTCMPLRQVMMP